MSASHLDRDEPFEPISISDSARLPPEQDEEDEDIYRGDPPPPHPYLQPQIPTRRRRRSSSSSSSTSTSSSSSSTTDAGGRLGAIAAAVEHALNRWVRANWSTSSLSSVSSSSSSSSSTSADSLRTFNSRPKRYRPRRKQSSAVTLLNAQHERDVAARIKARGTGRSAPREFALYLPPSVKVRPTPSPDQPAEDHIIRTDSLPLVLRRLEGAVRRSAKAQRAQNRLAASLQTPSDAPTRPPVPRTTSQPNFVLPSRLTEQQRGKGKQRVGFASAAASPRPAQDPGHAGPSGQTPPPFALDSSTDKAWFLDITSPTWEDMREIGKLLHIHPLTLEDILQQEPREKLELFPRLGYYFIIFRALEPKTRSAFRNYKPREGDSAAQEDDGLISEINLYLVVFRGGICAFHFSDISEHTDRVRNRLLMLEKSQHTSADWIAHSILDSVVDSLVPIVLDIEKEVVAIEALVAQGEQQPEDPASNPTPPSSTLPQVDELSEKETTEDASADGATLAASPSPETILSEKLPLPLTSSTKAHARFIMPAPTLRHTLRKLRKLLRTKLASLFGKRKRNRPRRRLVVRSTVLTLRRMARTRRLVTNLTRLLATKSEVVAKIQKRLLSHGEAGLVQVGKTAEGMEIAIHYGDVQDHILTLQHSLVHYERMLSQSHPTYLTQLRVSANQINSRLDTLLVMLSTISVGALAVQPVFGFFSLNIPIPTNNHSGNVYVIFGLLIAFALLEFVAYLALVRWWWKRSKRKRGRALG